MPTTAELAEKYIVEHPSIKDCLKYNVINYSRLARKISKELGIEKKSSDEAILVACRRYSLKLKKEQFYEEKVLKIMRNSELEIKNKIVVVIIDKKLYIENLLAIEKKIRRTADTFYAIEGNKVFTIILSEKYLPDLKKLFDKDILKISRNLAMVIIKSPEEMESTPGVIPYMHSLFGVYGVNIVETMSCWTDTIFVVAEDDIARVIKFLKV